MECAQPQTGVALTLSSLGIALPCPSSYKGGAIADRLQSDGPGHGDGKRPWPLEEKGQEIQEGDVERDKNRVKR